MTRPDTTSQSVIASLGSSSRGMPDTEVQEMPVAARHMPVTNTSSIVLNSTSVDTAMIRSAAAFDITYARPWQCRHRCLTLWNYKFSTSNCQDKITDKESWTMAQQDSMETTITRRKWTWIGHTMRNAGSSITKKLWDGPLKAVETEEDQRTHGRGQLRRSWEAWNWAEAKRRARHNIGRSGGISSAACALLQELKGKEKLPRWFASLESLKKILQLGKLLIHLYTIC